MKNIDYSNIMNLTEETLSDFYEYIIEGDFSRLINELRTQALNLSLKPSLNKLREDTIIDENKSVRWNRDFIRENNKKYKEEYENNKKRNQEKLALVDKLVLTEIHNVFKIKLTDEKAEEIYFFARSQTDSFLDAMHLIYELKELFKNVL